MTDRPRIESVRIQGFRSLADVTFRPNPGVTVLIGANGSGKSNLFRFFDLLRAMLGDHRLGLFVGLRGGADDQLHGGRAKTPALKAEIRATNGATGGDYAFSLSHADSDLFRFSEERFRSAGAKSGEPGPWRDLGAGHDEAKLIFAAGSAEAHPDRPTARAITDTLRDTAAYHFLDTSTTSPMKKKSDVMDNFRLHPDGGNLAPVLFRIEQEDRSRYEMIRHHIRRVLPGFGQFDIQPEFGKAYLFWRREGSDKRVGAHLTSDGSLRFFALATLLDLAPEALPGVLFLDEPELGLHPAAIPLLGGLIRSRASERQIIVATQSSLLADEFGLDQIRVLDLDDGRTRIRTLDAEEYRHWFEDYSVGELWETNVLGGGP